ncbi:dirigent protein 21-like [Rhododendron vialii]|uniref:dirigent protein 21-like n=1 Tax=Rhododendron vialii TaxID=182163 RepID=UPI00265EDF64|nr:dirigent protein 21-like [Rhododendron vialii]
MASNSLNFPLFTFFLVTLLITSITTTADGTFSDEVSEAISLKRIEKTTHLHFYFHDITSGKNPTAVKIAGPQDSPGVGFGSTFIIDDALTEGPELTSKLVGRAQGMYALASQNNNPELLMVVTYKFVEGPYNGSSISVLGRNPVMNDVREFPVVGGNGLFRLARGYALAHTVMFDIATGDVTVEYNVYVMHS